MRVRADDLKPKSSLEPRNSGIHRTSPRISFRFRERRYHMTAGMMTRQVANSVEKNRYSRAAHALRHSCRRVAEASPARRDGWGIRPRVRPHVRALPRRRVVPRGASRRRHANHRRTLPQVRRPRRAALLRGLEPNGPARERQANRPASLQARGGLVLATSRRDRRGAGRGGERGLAVVSLRGGQSLGRDEGGEQGTDARTGSAREKSEPR